jgi:hypothetical protein
MKHTMIVRSDIVRVRLDWQDDGNSPATLILTVLDAGLPPAVKESKGSEIKINVDKLEFEPEICLQILQAYVGNMVGTWGLGTWGQVLTWNLRYSGPQVS